MLISLFKHQTRTSNDEGHCVVRNARPERDMHSTLVFDKRFQKIAHHVHLCLLVELRLAPVNRVIEQIELVVGFLLELALHFDRVVNVGHNETILGQHTDRTHCN
jgi:hypothetical protein